MAKKKQDAHTKPVVAAKVKPVAAKPAAGNGTDALIKGASDAVKELVNDPAYITQQCEKLNGDDAVFFATATQQDIADVAYCAIHTQHEELKAKASRIIKNYALYKDK